MFLTSCALTREAAIAQQALQAALAVFAALRHSQRLLTLPLGGLRGDIAKTEPA